MRISTIADIQVSGEAPELPVLSRVSGNIFEKRLLDAYVAEHGKDPVNGEELSEDDIVEIKTSRSVKPRPPTATSIPSLLSIFQNEWDALALESYQIKQLLHQTRQELSTALYQHDAACRVIARITKERDEAREALSKVSENINGSGDQPMQTDAQEAVIPQKVQDIANATMEQESAGRKKRKVPEGWTTAEDLSGLKHARNRKADVELLDSSETPEEGKSLALHPSGLLVAASNNSSSWTLSNAEGSEVLATVTNDAGKTKGLPKYHDINSLIHFSNQDNGLPSGRSSLSSRMRRWQGLHLPPADGKSGSCLWSCGRRDQLRCIL